VDSACAERPTIPASRVSPFSLEITGKNVAQIRDFKFSIPLNMPVNVAFLGNESHRQRILAAKTIRECGFEPVPIISARRIRSQQDLDDLLGTLVMEATPRRFIFVGGDPRTPSGPYPDSLSLLGSGVLARHRIRDVGIVGYPEGHPKSKMPNSGGRCRGKSHFWKMPVARSKSRLSSDLMPTRSQDGSISFARWRSALRSESAYQDRPPSRHCFDSRRNLAFRYRPAPQNIAFR
jgi:hypothetical protein